MTVAALDIKQYTGVTPTKNTVTTPRMSTSDVYNPASANPLPLPDAGFTYSFWMSLALCITNMQDATLLNNHRFYSDGTCGWTLGSGGELYIGERDSGDNGCPEGSYDQATGTVGTTGDAMDHATNGHAYYKDQTPVWSAVDAYTSGSDLLIDSSDLTAAGDFKHVVLQAKLDTEGNGAVRGSQSAETLYFQYDEI